MNNPRSLFDINFDLQLQLSNYLYNNYPSVLEKLSTINKDLYSAILYTLRKYRKTDLKVVVELHDKNNIVQNLSLIHI